MRIRGVGSIGGSPQIVKSNWVGEENTKKQGNEVGDIAWGQGPKGLRTYMSSLELRGRERTRCAMSRVMCAIAD